MLTGSVVLLFIVILYGACQWLARSQKPVFFGRRKQIDETISNAFPRHPPKPEWVRKEILRFKTRLPLFSTGRTP